MSPAEAPESPLAASLSPERTSLLQYFSLTPSALTCIVDCIKPDRYDERTSPDRFTLREMIAHLADFEVTILDRIVTAQERPGAHVENFDEEARAIEKGYAQREVHHELQVFENRRRETILHLEGLTPAEMRQTFIHPQRGEMSVEALVGLVLGHDIYHLEQAARLLR